MSGNVRNPDNIGVPLPIPTQEWSLSRIADALERIAQAMEAKDERMSLPEKLWTNPHNLELQARYDEFNNASKNAISPPSGQHQ
jgi:hypothetical protein